jgi:phosphate/sulfate permease
VVLGQKTIQTVGSNITQLTPSRSFATQIGAVSLRLATAHATLLHLHSHSLYLLFDL